MKTRSALKTGFVLLFLVLAFGDRLFADDIPTFSDPDLNIFVKSYAQFVIDYVDAYKAAKSGDNSKLQALQSRTGELQAQAAEIPGKIKPDEAENSVPLSTGARKKSQTSLSNRAGVRSADSSPAGWLGTLRFRVNSPERVGPR